MRFRLVLLIALSAFTLAACAPEPLDTVETDVEAPAETEAPAVSAPQSYAVAVDASTEDPSGFYLSYFPTELEVHPGDTVEFEAANTGEPHTVTFGSLADAAAAQFQAMGPMEGEESPEAQALPMMSPPDNPLSFNQSGAQPCYLSDGAPADEACAPEDQEQPTFDGSQSFYNSGWLAPDSPFAVTFDENTPPGTYRYLCLLHRGVMVGSVTVVAPEDEVPDPQTVAEEADAAIDTAHQQLAAALESFPPPPENGVWAGALFEEYLDRGVMEFIPETVTISAGDTITWPILGPHTVSFDAPEGASTLRVELADGSVVVNEDAAAPVGGEGMPAPPPDQGETGSEEAPPDAGDTPPEPIEIDGGSWDGEGFHSSGLIVSFPPALFNYSMTFETPGTYRYQCLIHPDMEGTVIVE